MGAPGWPILSCVCSIPTKGRGRIIAVKLKPTADLFRLNSTPSPMKHCGRGADKETNAPSAVGFSAAGFVPVAVIGARLSRRRFAIRVKDMSIYNGMTSANPRPVARRCSPRTKRIRAYRTERTELRRETLNLLLRSKWPSCLGYTRRYL
jgi:hypothetical protein